MRNTDNRNRANKDPKKTRIGLSDPKQWDEFSMLVGMMPYSQLGSGARCKGKGCSQPAYDNTSRLCSYPRMEEAERAFEDRLKARQQAGRESGVR